MLGTPKVMARAAAVSEANWALFEVTTPYEAFRYMMNPAVSVDMAPFVKMTLRLAVAVKGGVRGSGERAPLGGGGGMGPLGGDLGGGLGDLGGGLGGLLALGGGLGGLLALGGGLLALGGGLLATASMSDAESSKAAMRTINFIAI